MKKPAWSHSSLKDYEGCARRYHVVRVLKKYPFEQTEAVIYGNEAHKAAEEYVRDGKALPKQFEFMQPTLDRLLQFDGEKIAEKEMALTVDLKPTGWFDSNVWVRGKADLMIVDHENLTARVIDYKTGKDKYPDREQLKLMSMLVFAHFPLIRKVNSALLFVVKDTMVTDSMMRDECEDEWWRYRERLAKLEASFTNNVWNPKQTPLCGWCPVRECEFNNKH